MGAPRRVARTLLALALRMAPEVSREWARAMLSELEFIDGEWAALWWAIGGTAAVLRHAARNWQEWMGSARNKEERMNSTGKKAIGVAAGALGALALAGCAFALLRIADLLFPGLDIARTEWTHWLSVIVIPEAVFLTSGILLWRKRGPVAAGILMVGFALGLHVAIHVASAHHL
jgi:hypothetical protein